MQVDVHQLAFQNTGIRSVIIPDDGTMDGVGTVLNAVFHWGQNDFQNVPGKYSVSVGDVIDLGSSFPQFSHRYYLVVGVGFAPMTQAQFEKYVGIPLDQRYRIGYMSQTDIVSSGIADGLLG
jgi:hypothetical protein